MMDAFDWTTLGIAASCCGALLCTAFFVLLMHWRGRWVLCMLHAPTLVVLAITSCVHIGATLLVAHRAAWPWAAHSVLLTPWLEFVLGMQAWVGVLVDRALIYGLIFQRTMRLIGRVDRLRVGTQVLVALPGGLLAVWGTFRAADHTPMWIACVAAWLLLLLAEKAGLAAWVRHRNVQRTIAFLRTPYAHGVAVGIGLPLAYVPLRIIVEAMPSLLEHSSVLRNALVLVVVAMHATTFVIIVWQPLRIVLFCYADAETEWARRLELVDVYGNGETLAVRINSAVDRVVGNALPLPRESTAAAPLADKNAFDRLCMSLFLEYCASLPSFTYNRRDSSDGALLADAPPSMRSLGRRTASIMSGGSSSTGNAADIALEPYAIAITTSPFVVVYPRRLAVAVDAIDARIACHHTAEWRRRGRDIIRRFLTPPAESYAASAVAVDVDASSSDYDDDDGSGTRAASDRLLPLVDWRYMYADSEYIEPVSSREYEHAEACRRSSTDVRLDNALFFDALRGAYLQRLHAHAAVAFSLFQLRTYEAWQHVRASEVERARRFGLLPANAPAVWNIIEGRTMLARNSPRSAAAAAAAAPVPMHFDMITRGHDQSAAQRRQQALVAGTDVPPRMLETLPESLHDYRVFFRECTRDAHLLEEIEHELLLLQQRKTEAAASSSGAGASSAVDDDDDDDQRSPRTRDAEDVLAAIALGLAAGDSVTTADDDSPVMQDVPLDDMPTPERVGHRQAGSFIGGRRSRSTSRTPAQQHAAADGDVVMFVDADVN
jgi:hypothetical protein